MDPGYNKELKAIFRRNNIIASLFELESKESNHVISDEEATLHKYRNRINFK